MEDLFRKNGVMCTPRIMTPAREYIDNITFCKTYNIFHEISDYMEYIVDKTIKYSLQKSKSLKQKNIII